MELFESQRWYGREAGKNPLFPPGNRTNIERKSKNKTSLEGIIKGRMVQTIKYLIKTHINKNN
jgi:hypothetical protein